LGQSVPPLEVIVVDDGSTDRTAAVASRFAVKLVRRGVRGGAGAARDEGARTAAGEILAFLDADCIAPADWIARIVHEFDADADLMGLGGLYDWGNFASFMGSLCGLEGRLMDRVRGDPSTNYPQGGNAAFRKAAWDEARSGRECSLFAGIAGGEDRLVWEELRQRDLKLKTIESLRVMHLPASFAGYLRRHFYRGQALMLGARAASLERRGAAVLGIYGGLRIIVSSISLGLALAAAPLIFILPAAGLPLVAALLALHGVLWLAVYRPLSEAGPGVGLPWTWNVGLRFALLARMGCWAAGAVAAFARRAGCRLRALSRVLRATLLLAVPGRTWRLFVFATARCNASCPFCLNTPRAAGASGRNDELSLDEIRKIADSLGTLSFLTLTGGEPFLRDDVSDIVDVFCMRCGTAWVTITTNGTLPEAISRHVRSILASHPSLLLTLQVSIDAVGPAHDASRRIPGAFDAVCRTMRELKFFRRSYPNFRVQVATPFDGPSGAEARAAWQYCRTNFEYDQHVFYLIRKPGERWTDDTNSIIPAYLRLVREAAARERSGNRLGLWGWFVFRLAETVSEMTVRVKPGHAWLCPCRAGEKFVTLYENGDLAPCEIRNDLRFQNVRETALSLPASVNAPLAGDIRRRVIRGERCACEWPCATQLNLLLTPRTWPGLLRNARKGANGECRG